MQSPEYLARSLSVQIFGRHLDSMNHLGSGNRLRCRRDRCFKSNLTVSYGEQVARCQFRFSYRVIVEIGAVG